MKGYLEGVKPRGLKPLTPPPQNGSAKGINHNTQALFNEHECDAIKYK